MSSLISNSNEENINPFKVAEYIENEHEESAQTPLILNNLEEEK